MTSRRPTTTSLGAAAPSTTPLLLGVELVRADVARSSFGLELGEAPCGGPVTWALFIDAVLVGRTDEAMTDDAARAWAWRITGDGVRFQLGRPGGGYWLADTTDVADLGDRRRAEGGWSR
ncbi:hypothetical protein Acsp06_56720 [Actinomycetospora sp. NBRC 106375]|uniref:hypothetical protein n=1 Tax=Actinomycetospora sp. NBRC 106375 TaxID=3032207 RepID=UPI0024A3703E|nr:hypothetical protein [Actinomycetospora sp. NBRC 106375]GLZ49487.1 hypothetical protein Acsp06_56720 [Actinomycetospora sp. NBRC 106375]